MRERMRAHMPAHMSVCASASGNTCENICVRGHAHAHPVHRHSGGDGAGEGVPLTWHLEYLLTWHLEDLLLHTQDRRAVLVQHLLQTGGERAAVTAAHKTRRPAPQPHIRSHVQHYTSAVAG
eukprot:93237-Prorocentrum_minimum.AAC.2